jgi:hypothetical protein
MEPSRRLGARPGAVLARSSLCTQRKALTGQAEQPAFLPPRVSYGAIAQLVEHLHGMQGGSGGESPCLHQA